MQRKLLIAGNWKMNPIPDGALTTDSAYQPHPTVDVWVFPTAIDLRTCLDAGIIAGGQFGHPEATGAYTGDISLQMLKELGCTTVLCGHSDRRAFHGESNEDVAEQVSAALDLGLQPIACLGETLEQQQAGDSEAVVRAAVEALPLECDLIIAYEPVWAISRGDPNCPAATPDDAQQMHAFIRSLLPTDRQASTRLLYGGSMKPENAQELLSQPDIDGGLVGGASLVPEKFGQIVTVATQMTT